MTDPTQRELTEARINIARLQEQVTHLSESMEALKETNQQQSAKLDQVLLTLSEARGGWKTLMAVGGAASLVTGLIGWLISHMPRF